MSDRASLLLIVLIAAAATAFGLLMMDLPWPLALLLGATPGVVVGSGILLKNRTPNDPSS